MELSRAHYPVTVLGWGRRAGLWLQGCSIRCRGCMAKDTWARRPERAVPVPAIVDWLDSLGPLDGLTVSGGEPLDQAEELTLLLRAVRERWPSGFDVLCYTGRELGQAKAVSPELFELADAVAAGPFEPGCPPAPALSGLLGSGNQRLVALTALGRERYSASPPRRAGLQAAVADGDLYLVGVPGPGDLAAVSGGLERHGLALRRRSWAG